MQIFIRLQYLPDSGNFHAYRSIRTAQYYAALRLPSAYICYLLIENRWAVRRITKCYVDATAFAHAQLMLYMFVYIPAQRPKESVIYTESHIRRHVNLCCCRRRVDIFLCFVIVNIKCKLQIYSSLSYGYTAHWYVCRHHNALPALKTTDSRAQH